MAGESGKRIYEALTDLQRVLSDTTAEPSLDEVVNALIDLGVIAKSHDGTGRSFDLWTAARSFQKQYRNIGPNGSVSPGGPQ